MSQDKTKQKQQKRARVLFALAGVTGAFLLLCGAYWRKFGVLPIADGETARFLKFWEWIV